MSTSDRQHSMPPVAAHPRRGVRVIVVDDHAAVREGIRAMLASEPDLDPIAVTATAGDALALAERHRPDVMVLDYHLPDEDGLSLCLRLKSTDDPPAALIYSAFADHHLVALAIIAGADALMSKATDPDELCDVVRALAAGTARMPTVVAMAMNSIASRLDTEDLPILGMLANRTPPAQIAATLRMDEGWLTTRRWAMLSRLAGGSARRRSAREPHLGDRP
ncbi:MAG: response regulator transcription factor [Actinomycetota bacterium]|nr:response regulator transcription factor [Actinomycetota bacterium]